MFAWLTANGSTIIISMILLLLMVLAGRKVLKNKGGCSCGHCGGCHRCDIWKSDEKNDQKS